MHRLLALALLALPALARGQSGLFPSAPSAPWTCDATTRGDGYSNSTDGKAYYCDGSAWIDLGGSGAITPPLVIPAASGPTYGSDVVTNGSFTGNAAGWTLGGGGGAPDWAYASNNVTHGNGGGTAALEPSTPLTVVAGHVYAVTFTTSAVSAGTVTASIGGVPATATPISGTWRYIITATGTGSLNFTPTTTFVGTLDTISVQEITAESVPSITITDGSFSPEIRANTTQGSIFIGQMGGRYATSSASNNTMAGLFTGRFLSNGTNNSVWGSQAFGGTSGSDNTAIGFASSPSLNGNKNTCIGRSACTNLFTGSSNTIVGYVAGATGGPASWSFCHAYGDTAQCAASNQGVFGGNGAGGGMTEAYWGHGITKASPEAFNLRGTGGSGSNNAGSNLTITPGLGTGTAAGGDTILQRSPSVLTGAALQTPADALFIRSQKKTLADGVATAVARISVPQGVAGLTGWTGGTLSYTVVANDATNYQAHRGSVNFAFVNEAGTEACTNLGTVSGIADATPTGTLTATVTGANNAADTCDLLINAASSLAESTLAAFWSIVLDGPGTVTPQ